MGTHTQRCIKTQVLQQGLCSTHSRKINKIHAHTWVQDYNISLHGLWSLKFERHWKIHVTVVLGLWRDVRLWPDVFYPFIVRWSLSNKSKKYGIWFYLDSAKGQGETFLTLRLVLPNIAKLNSYYHRPLTSEVILLLRQWHSPYSIADLSSASACVEPNAFRTNLLLRRRSSSQ